MPERRLCGPLDRRRKSHRCEQCRRDHLKCDSARPCANCARRGLHCTTPSPPQQARSLQIISSIRHGVNTRQIPRHPTLDRAEQYGAVFFSAVGENPIVLEMFSVDSLSSAIHSDATVKDAVSVIGGLYAVQNPYLLALSCGETCHLFTRLRALRESIAAELASAAVVGRAAYATLTRALLLSFAEILVDPTGQQWVDLVRQLYAFSRLSEASQSNPQSSFQRSLPTLIRIMNALCAVVLEQEFRHGAAQPPPLDIRDVSALSSKDEKLLHFAVDVEMWAWLQNWTRTWETKEKQKEKEEEEMNHSSAIPDAEQLTAQKCRGLELTCIGSQFQRHVLSTVSWYTTQATEKTFASAMLAIYHGISIDVSNMFAGPAWLRLGCELPVMPHRLSYEQATNALGHAERSISALQLEAIFYSPILYVLGVGMARKADRRRMVDFIGQVRQRGFLVVDQFLASIEQEWASGGS